jgi:Raf kinase inhibitor-like YbhB/YbcL family protein
VDADLAGGRLVSPLPLGQGEYFELGERDMRTGMMTSRVLTILAAAAILGLGGCPRGERRPSEGAALEEPEPAAGAAEPAEIELTTTAFEPGGPIPAKYTDDGDDVSPPLSWSGVPEGTKELALICDDPDAPSPKRPAPDPWVHWLIYKIPADGAGLPEGIPKTARLDDPAGAVQGKNSWPTIGYRGPAPPSGSGTHRYVFTLYALDTELRIEPEADKQALFTAMSGHVIGKGQLIGTYER